MAKKQARAITHRAFGSIDFLNDSYFAKCLWCGSLVDFDFDFDCADDKIDAKLDMAAHLIDFQDVWGEKLAKYAKDELVRIQDNLRLSWSVRTRNRIAKGLTTYLIIVHADDYGVMDVKFFLDSDDPAFPNAASRFYIRVCGNNNLTFTGMELEGGD